MPLDRKCRVIFLVGPPGSVGHKSNTNIRLDKGVGGGIGGGDPIPLATVEVASQAGILHD